ncbi:unnamed protein product [Pieris macdunnoughi]|uniref:Uncharacterized protein n=1 Tax=Pieris macdunnoughi TaxID=345717 RepID=A0A821V9F6_9NEOP|nr:unnamed protein product [Pieris macdunnoughi]
MIKLGFYRNSNIVDNASFEADFDSWLAAAAAAAAGATSELSYLAALHPAYRPVPYDHPLYGANTLRAASSPDCYAKYRPRSTAKFRKRSDMPKLNNLLRNAPTNWEPVLQPAL